HGVAARLSGNVRNPVETPRFFPILHSGRILAFRCLGKVRRPWTDWEKDMRSHSLPASQALAKLSDRFIDIGSLNPVAAVSRPPADPKPVNTAAGASKTRKKKGKKNPVPPPSL